MYFSLNPTLTIGISLKPLKDRNSQYGFLKKSNIKILVENSQCFKLYSCPKIKVIFSHFCLRTLYSINREMFKIKCCCIWWSVASSTTQIHSNRAFVWVESFNRTWALCKGMRERERAREREKGHILIKILVHFFWTLQGQGGQPVCTTIGLLKIHVLIRKRTVPLAMLTFTGKAVVRTNLVWEITSFSWWSIN